MQSQPDVTDAASASTELLGEAKRTEIAELLLDRIRTNPGILEDGHTGVTYLRFLPLAFDMSCLGGSKGWTPSGRMLLFEFQNRPRGLALTLIIGPGEQAKRQYLIQTAASGTSELLKLPSGKPGQKWSRIYRRSFGRASDMHNMARDDLADHLKRNWESFVIDDLPVIVDSLSESIHVLQESSGP